MTHSAEIEPINICRYNIVTIRIIGPERHPHHIVCLLATHIPPGLHPLRIVSVANNLCWIKLHTPARHQLIKAGGLRIALHGLAVRTSGEADFRMRVEEHERPAAPHHELINGIGRLLIERLGMGNHHHVNGVWNRVEILL